MDAETHTTPSFPGLKASPSPPFWWRSQGAQTAQRASAVGAGLLEKQLGLLGLPPPVPLPRLWLLLGRDTSPQELKVIKGMNDS